MAKQIVVSISSAAQVFIAALCAAYQGPGVTKETDLTQREAVDTMIEFIQSHRHSTQEIPVMEKVPMVDDDGNIIMKDDGSGYPVLHLVEKKEEHCIYVPGDSGEYETDPETGEYVTEWLAMKEIVPIDLFEKEVTRTLALRDVSSRVATSTAKLQDQAAEIANLKAMLAKLQAAG